MAIRTSCNKTSANTSYQKAASTISSAKTAKSKATASSSKKTSTSKKSASSTAKRDTFTYSTQQKKTQTKNTSSSKASSKRDTLTISSQAAKIKNTDNVKKGTASKNAQSSNKSKTSSNVAANMTKANSSSKTAKSTSTSVSKATKAQINNAVSSLAAKNAGISIASDGTPKINSSSDAKRYMNELNKLKGSEVSIKAATAAGVKVDSYGNPIINSASDAKTYLEAYKSLKPQYNYKNDLRYQALTATVNSKNIETYKKNFVMEAFPHALECEKETGIPAEIIFGQICTESEYGSNTLIDKYTGKEAHNYFGIKGVGPSGSVTCDTTEYVSGKKVFIEDKFRAYNNMEESIDDYAKLLKNNYAPYTTSGTAEDWANALVEGGYATAPDYGNFILDVAATWGIYDEK